MKRTVMDQKAQSTFEYIILVAAVVAVIVAFASSSFFKDSVNKVIDDGVDQLAKTTEGVDFDIPSEGVDFFTPPPNKGDPPEEWETPAVFSCWGGPEVSIEFLELDDDGLPVFSPPEEYIGNYCAEEIWQWEDPEIAVGDLQFDHNGNLLIVRITGPGQRGWVPFDWNDQGHITSAFMRQRYGPHHTNGCGMGGHDIDFAGFFFNIFGRKGTCWEILDHFYGHTRMGLSGLTGDLAKYNGLTLADASFKKNLLEHLLVPGDPSYVGTPSNPGEGFWWHNREAWIDFYERALRVGLRDQLPFTRADIDAAFPPEG